MNSEAKNEIGGDYNNGQALEFREAAALALKPHSCDLVVRRVGDGITRLVIKVPGGEIRLRSSLECLPNTPINSEREADS